jgi:hypothetical protein
MAFNFPAKPSITCTDTDCKESPSDFTRTRAAGSRFSFAGAKLPASLTTGGS